MMKINRKNYEIYFLDYLDGNLPGDQIDDFLDFLKNNPDLHEELKAVSSFNKLSPGGAVFQKKETLLKDGRSGVSDFDYQAVAYLEGDLEEDDEKAFLETITNDKASEKEFDLFLKTKLVPNDRVVFPNKVALHRKSGVKVLMYWTSRVAAGLILLFGLWAVWNHQSNNVESQPNIVQKQPQNDDNQTTPQKNREIIQPKTEKLVDAQTPDKLSPVQQKQPVLSTPAAIEKPGLVALKERLEEREVAPRKIVPVPVQSVSLAGESSDVQFAMNKTSEKQTDKYLTVNGLLAEKVWHQKQGESVSLSRVLTAGLEAVSSVSNDRLKYETNPKGKISEISLNTRLLAFSIPLKKR
ncbi:MAG TPA: hypothetical protein VKA27_08935 [Sunxiuqinia sp.]|nr:hypothetical protein [Sunxiuqinia sp.]